MTELQKTLADLADRFALADIYVFGSRAREIVARVRGEEPGRSPEREEGAEPASSGSDVDIGVRPLEETRLTAADRVELTLGLEDAFDAPRVDLVVLAEAGAFLALSAIQGELLYCRDADDQAEYELYVLRRAGDLAPFERERRELILKHGGR